MDLVDRLALIIDAHTEGAVSSIKKLSLEEAAAAERTDVLKAKIADLNTRMARSATGGTALQQRQLAKLNGEYQTLTATLGNVPRSATRVESALSRLGLGGVLPAGTIGAATKALPGLAAGAAVFGGFEFLKHGVDNFEALATEIRTVAQEASSSVPDASKLVAVTHALGVDSGQAGLAVFRLGKNVDTGGAKLAQYGVTIARTKDGNTDLIGTLFNVADAYQHTSDSAQRAALVQAAFGRGGQVLLPILNATKSQLSGIVDEAGKQGRIFTAQDLQSAQDYQVQVREMDTAFQSLGITAARTLVPALTDLFGILTKIGDISHPGGEFFGGLFAPITEPFKLAGRALGIHGHSSGPAVQPLSPDQQAALDSLNALGLGIAGTPGGAFDTSAGPAAVKAATTSLDKARTTLATAKRERDAALRGLDAAQRSGASASSLNAAQARLDAANATLKTALYVGGDARIASARSAVASAQNSLNTAEGAGVGTSDRLKSAQDRLATANQRVKDATNQVKSAEDRLNQARGLTAEQLLHRITGGVKEQRQKLADDLKLAHLGIAPAVLAEITTLNAQIPGTLHRVAETATRGLVGSIDKEFDAKNHAEQLARAFGQGFAAAPELYLGGKAAGEDLARGVVAGFKGGITLDRNGNITNYGALGNPFSNPPGAGANGSGAGAPRQVRGVDGYMQPAITVQGDLVIQGKSAKQVARDVLRDNRLRALGSGYAGA